MFRYSVIIPYRDKYDLLLTAVDSIPDREDIQIIVVDNSDSPLPSESVPSKLYSRLDYLLSEPGLGAGRARNKGLSAAEGEFILFLDADDYFTHDAFETFDRYSASGSDIVFFNATSVTLSDGKPSDRHLYIDSLIRGFMAGNGSGMVRYRFDNPVPKMFLASFVQANQIRFDEVRCSNDTMFSLKTGHLASLVTVVDKVVYVITEGRRNTTLTSTRSRENQFTRFMVSLDRNRYCKSIGKTSYSQRLLPPIFFAFRDFGLKEMLRYLKAWKESGVSLLSGYFTHI